MRRRGTDDHGQLQLLESVTVAVFIFVAIAVVSIHRLPTSPQIFQQGNLQKTSLGLLNTQLVPGGAANDDCNESPCPFATDLDRLLSLALGYVGPNATVGNSQGFIWDGKEDLANDTELRNLLQQALPSGANFLFVYSNGYNHTRVSPAGVQPPASNVVVARTLVSPNWTVYGDNLTQSVLLRVNETTGFGDVDYVFDPLNRTRTEFNVTWSSLFQDRVPSNATYGTHKLCKTGNSTCRYATVVPAGVVGAGGQVLPQDQELSPTLRTIGAWNARAKFKDNLPLTLGPEDKLYIDEDDDLRISAGDLRLTNVSGCRGLALKPCEAGSLVRLLDTDVDPVTPLSTLPVNELRLRSDDAVAGEGESVYVFATAKGSVGAGDFRVSRVGQFGMGTWVAAADFDSGRTTPNFFDSTLAVVQYGDRNNNTALDEGEAVYLNLDGLGQSSNLETYDVHLSPVGLPTVRYVYDVKLVTWYGV